MTELCHRHGNNIDRLESENEKCRKIISDHEFTIKSLEMDRNKLNNKSEELNNELKNTSSKLKMKEESLLQTERNLEDNKRNVQKLQVIIDKIPGVSNLIPNLFKNSSKEEEKQYIISDNFSTADIQVGDLEKSENNFKLGDILKLADSLGIIPNKQETNITKKVKYEELIQY